MKVYMTYRNADTTEGRGPMVPDKCFSKLEDANDYIDLQSGVMGRKAKWSEQKHGDWYVAEVNVCDSLGDAEHQRIEEIKRKALSKLTPEGKRRLGL